MSTNNATRYPVFTITATGSRTGMVYKITAQVEPVVSDDSTPSPTELDKAVLRFLARNFNQRGEPEYDNVLGCLWTGTIYNDGSLTLEVKGSDPSLDDRGFEVVSAVYDKLYRR